MTNHPIDTRRRCPNCHKSTLQAFFQKPLVPTKQGKWYVHCSEPECAGHDATLMADQYQGRYTTEDQNA